MPFYGFCTVFIWLIYGFFVPENCTIKAKGGRGTSYKFYNPNPKGAKVGDCVIRAMSKAAGLDWETTYIEMAVLGFQMCDMPSANAVWGAFLRKRGFVREIVPNECPDCYTVSDFCRDHLHGIYVLAVKNHVVCVIDGNWYDSFNSGNEIVLYYLRKDD